MLHIQFMFLFRINTVDHRHNIVNHSNITVALHKNQVYSMLNIEHEQRNNHLIWSVLFSHFTLFFFIFLLSARASVSANTNRVLSAGIVIYLEFQTSLFRWKWMSFRIWFYLFFSFCLCFTSPFRTNGLDFFCRFAYTCSRCGCSTW